MDVLGVNGSKRDVAAGARGSPFSRRPHWSHFSPIFHSPPHPLFTFVVVQLQLSPPRPIDLSFTSLLESVPLALFTQSPPIPR